MASPTYRDVPNINISSGVKARLQKWIGRASTNVRDKRTSKEISAEIIDYEPRKVQVTGDLLPQHSRSRSSPIPMPAYTEKVPKNRRKTSVSTPPTCSVKEDRERENGRIDSYPKNGIPRGITHSVGLHESSSVPSSVLLQRQNALDCCSEETTLGDKTGSVVVNMSGRADKDNINGMNGLNAGALQGSRATRKHNVLNRRRSKTSVDLEGESGSSGNGRMVSAVSLDSIPKNVQQLSGQIQSRLQMWVERASYLAAQRDRRHSDESASSTDDSLNAPDSPFSRTPGSAENESQVKKIKELELALKELVENVGVRGASWPSKLQDATCSHSPGSSSGKGSRKNSQRHDSNRQENGELNGIEKDDLIDKVSRAARKARSRDSRNNSSSSADSDTASKMSDSDKPVFDSQQRGEDQEDLDDGIFMKSSNPTRESANYSPRERKSVNLQDVLICETLIEDIPKRGEHDNSKTMAPRFPGKNYRDETVLESKGTKERTSEVVDNKSRSGKMVSTAEQKDNENSKTLSENKLISKNGTGKKLDRAKLKKRAIASDVNSLKVGPSLAVRESMRQYLNFRDADLSAFAVECVRHANKKKQVMREGDQEQDNQESGEKMGPQKNTNDTKALGATEQKPSVVISSQDNDQQTNEANGLIDRALKLECARSSGSPLDNETAEEIKANEIISRNVFARTAEEAELYEKEQALIPVPQRKESLERSSSNPPRDPVSTSGRLYKFPSMPMFYIPSEDGDSDTKQEKKDKRKSVASFPYALHDSFNAGMPDPFYHGETGSTTKPARSSSSSKLTSKDENGNDLAALKQKSSPRPKLGRRKISAPSTSSLYMPSNVRVDIEALI